MKIMDKKTKNIFIVVNNSTAEQMLLTNKYIKVKDNKKEQTNSNETSEQNKNNE